MSGYLADMTFTVKAGSNHITRDIAAALGCDVSEAEELKRKFGLRRRPAGPMLTESDFSKDQGSKEETRTVPGVSSIKSVVPVSDSKLLIFLPSLPINRPLINTGRLQSQVLR